MATLSDFNGQASFTIGGNSFNNRASSGTPIYERTGGGGGSTSAGGFIDSFSFRLSNPDSQTLHTFPSFDPSTQVLLIGNDIDGEHFTSSLGGVAWGDGDSGHALNEIPVVTAFGSTMSLGGANGLAISPGNGWVGVNSAGSLATYYTGSDTNGKWFTVLRFTRAGGGSVGAEVKAILHAKRAARFQEGDTFVTGPRAFNSTFVSIQTNDTWSSISQGGWGLKFDFITPIENPIVQATTAGIGIYSTSSAASQTYTNADIQIQEMLVSSTSVTIGIRDISQTFSSSNAIYMPYLEWSAVVY